MNEEINNYVHIVQWENETVNLKMQTVEGEYMTNQNFVNFVNPIFYLCLILIVFTMWFMVFYNLTNKKYV